MIAPETYPHTELLSACRKQNRQAQQKIYQLYARPMFNVCYRIVNQHEEAEDVLQEAFIKMFREIDTYREEASFGSWFKRIVVNTSLNHLKKKKRQLANFESYAYESEEHIVEEEENDHPSNFTVSQVQNAMELLPEGYRVVFSLYLFEDYSHKEIAEELGIAESTSKSQLNRAKRKLREIINSSLN